MKWAEIRVGMLVLGEADDHYQLEDQPTASDSRAEYPFRFFGVVEQITQRKLVVRGVWKWACADDEIPRAHRFGETGRFGILRGVMYYVSEAVSGRTWTPAERGKESK